MRFVTRTTRKKLLKSAGWAIMLASALWCMCTCVCECVCVHVCVCVCTCVCVWCACVQKAN